MRVILPLLLFFLPLALFGNPVTTTITNTGPGPCTAYGSISGVGTDSVVASAAASPPQFSIGLGIPYSTCSVTVSAWLEAVGSGPALLYVQELCDADSDDGGPQGGKYSVAGSQGGCLDPGGSDDFMIPITLGTPFELLASASGSVFVYSDQDGGFGPADGSSGLGDGSIQVTITAADYFGAGYGTIPGCTGNCPLELIEYPIGADAIVFATDPSSVPEPSTWLLSGGLVLAGALRRRR